MIGFKRLLPPYDPDPDWNIVMAATFFVMLPPTVVILALQRWFTKGLVDVCK